jgi:hypothetical protein
MIKASVQDGTRAKRFKYIAEFKGFLSDNQRTDIFSEIDIVNFLAEKHQDSGAAFEQARTAIATTLNLQTDYDVTKSIDFRRQAKGGSNLKPKEPKYDDMWNLSLLFDFLEKPLWPNKPTIAARCKANMLIRASVAGRNNDVTYIHRSSMIWTDTAVSFRFYNWKTKHLEGIRLSRLMTTRKLPAAKSHVCAYSALKIYMDLHESDYARINPEGIWLNYRGTAMIAPPTLAMDTRKAMLEANIPNLYGAATIRHATITFWREQGIPMDVVMDRTGHRSSSLVRKFYDKSKISHDIMAALMESESDEEFLAASESEGEI